MEGVGDILQAIFVIIGGPDSRESFEREAAGSAFRACRERTSRFGHSK